MELAGHFLFALLVLCSIITTCLVTRSGLDSVLRHCVYADWSILVELHRWLDGQGRGEPTRKVIISGRLAFLCPIIVNALFAITVLLVDLKPVGEVPQNPNPIVIAAIEGGAVWLLALFLTMWANHRLEGAMGDLGAGFDRVAFETKLTQGEMQQLQATSTSIERLVRLCGKIGIPLKSMSVLLVESYTISMKRFRASVTQENKGWQLATGMIEFIHSTCHEEFIKQEQSLSETKIRHLWIQSPLAMWVERERELHHIPANIGYQGLLEAVVFGSHGDALPGGVRQRFLDALRSEILSLPRRLIERRLSPRRGVGASRRLEFRLTGERDGSDSNGNFFKCKCRIVNASDDGCLLWMRTRDWNRLAERLTKGNRVIARMTIPGGTYKRGRIMYRRPKRRWFREGFEIAYCTDRAIDRLRSRANKKH